MSWKNRYGEIKVGDTVKCIKTPNQDINSDTGTANTNINYPGCGWELDKIFVVSNIEPVGDRKIYWGKDMDGVFFEHVIKVK
jgi:hypothetical protein